MMPQTLKLLFQHFLKKSVFILLLFGLTSFGQETFKIGFYNVENFLEYSDASIFHPKWLHTPPGRYKGYPFRTQKKGGFLTGYSDHFPVTITIRVK